MKKWLGLVVALVLALSVGTAQAAFIQVDFTAENFTQIGDGIAPPPTDPVTGTIIYEAASTTANIDSLSSINLTIDGHAYPLNEVGFISPNGDFQIIGGTAGLMGVWGAEWGLDDFYLLWYQTALTPLTFVYTSSSYSDSAWESRTFSNFSVTEVTPVPEPCTILLLGSGLTGIASLRRRLKR